MDSELLTTGQVAKMCGVTSDAVLKWIKKGRLPAVRTAGGHFRVSRSALAAFTDGRSGAPTRDAEDQPGRLRCWEYFGEAGNPGDACIECLVYRMRAERCYEVADLGDSIGHKRKFCRTDCKSCSFFRACQGLATKVLIITPDENLIRRLKKQTTPGALSMHFARSGYEGSVLVGTHSPAVVVMDAALPEVREGMLLESILKDDRVPGVRVLVSLRKGARAPAGRYRVPVIPSPFGVAELEQALADLSLPAGASPGNVAGGCRPGGRES